MKPTTDASSGLSTRPPKETGFIDEGLPRQVVVVCWPTSIDGVPPLHKTAEYCAVPVGHAARQSFGLIGLSSGSLDEPLDANGHSFTQRLQPVIVSQTSRIRIAEGLIGDFAAWPGPLGPMPRLLFISYFQLHVFHVHPRCCSHDTAFDTEQDIELYRSQRLEDYLS